jgi:hypothetical protein
MNSNEKRIDFLIDAAELLTRTSPTEQTFNDTYKHAVSKLVNLADNLDEGKNIVRKTCLLEAVNLLEQTGPTEKTYHDTYKYAISKLVEMANNLIDDVRESATLTTD